MSIDIIPALPVSALAAEIRANKDTIGGKEFMKKTLMFIAAVFMAVMMSMTAFAGEWKQDTSGWWYENENGECFYNGWQWIDGNNDNIAEAYYFNESGYCLMNTETPDGFFVDSNGAWVVDGIVQTKNLYKDEAVYAAETVPASTEVQAPAVSNTVYLPATGEKYHRIPNCGRMNPDKAREVSLSDAISRGYEPCSKCY